MSKPLSTSFVGYASSDKAMLEELLPYLEVFERTDQASVWCDRNIKLGAPWAASIDEALATCDVALLLVSQKFIVSNVIRGAPPCRPRLPEEAAPRSCQWSPR